MHWIFDNLHCFHGMGSSGGGVIKKCGVSNALIWAENDTFDKNLTLTLTVKEIGLHNFWTMLYPIPTVIKSSMASMMNKWLGFFSLISDKNIFFHNFWSQKKCVHVIYGSVLYTENYGSSCDLLCNHYWLNTDEFTYDGIWTMKYTSIWST